MNSYARNLLSLLILINITVNTFAYNGKGYTTGNNRRFDFPNNSQTTAIQAEPQSQYEWEPLAPITPEVEKRINQIRTIEKLVANGNRFISKLDSSAIMEYPVGIVKTIGNSNYSILLNQDEITTKGATLNASMSFPIPGGNDSMQFSATGIPLSSIGGFSGDIKLSLLSSHHFNLGPNVRVTILGGETKSYATFNCNGFKNMTISAKVEFASSVFLCENPATGAIIPKKKLTTEFNITIENWNNFIVQLSVDPFQIKGIQGVGFEAKNIVLDFSDYANPSGIAFPQGYQSTYFTAGNQNLWRGFYIQQATVRLPPEFKKKNPDSKDSVATRVSFSANNLIIDNLGLSGDFHAEHLLEAGDMGGWGFSVDKFDLILVSNSIKEATFSGKMSVPMLDSTLNYAAMMGMNGDYSFTASTTKANKFGMWGANLTLAPNSTIIVKSVNGNFLPEANLNGELVINASLSDNGNSSTTDKSKKVSLADITFQNLHLQTVKPYVQIGEFSFGSEKADQAMAGFPLQIKEIGAETTDNELALKLRIIINIADGGFGADGSFRIIAENKDSHWKFKSVEVDKASIDIVSGPIKMKGYVMFYKNDSTYGNGFQGGIDAEFSMGLKLQANAMFGKVKGMRYWYADAKAELSSGIPIFTGIAIYGFGGGAYYHMKQNGTTTATNRIGVTPSGVVYKPDINSGLGLKASVIIASTPSKSAFNGEAGFEIAFNTSGGVRFIAFTGKASFITPPIPDALKSITDGAQKIGSGKEAVSTIPDARGSINASLYISYDFTNNTLDGNLKTFVNIAGLITGSGPNNSAGEAILHFAPSEWYIYIGTPTNPIGLKFMGLAETHSYFMVGTKIPSSPPPPSNVSAILGGINTDYMKDLNALGSGSGIAFGSGFSVNTGDLSFLMFYASFQAGMGFDVMLKNYGNATCQGSSSPLGIDGWYANGQAYAYISGKVGIQVKIFHIHKKVNILDISMAALLQAKLPNPTWLHGAVGGQFNVLGGVVKGSCNFEFTLGEECKIVGASALSGTEIIADVTPGNDSKDINVFTAPQVIFNYGVEQPFNITEEDNTISKYRVKLENFDVTLDGTTIEFNREWNNDHTVLALKPIDVLPGQKSLKATVTVSFEQMKNGVWSTVYDNGAKITETKTNIFVTAAAPDYIPPSNIQYSYPVINQYNYYKDETIIGYIKLKLGQDELFDAKPGFQQKGRFVSLKTGNKLLCDFTYDKTNNEINFNRPDGLSLGEPYHFELVNIPTTTASAIDANVSSKTTKEIDLTDGNDINTTTKQAVGVIQNVKEKVFYSSTLRTSSYSTFRDKVQAFTTSPTYLDYLRVNVEFLSLYSWNSEIFDQFERYGQDQAFAPLVQAKAVLSNTEWYNNVIFPYIYKDYPITNNISITSRDVNILGIPPIKAVSIYQSLPYLQVSDDLISQDVLLNKKAELVTFDYNLPSSVDYDVADLKTKAANCIANGTPMTSRIKLLIEYDSPLLIKGNYFLNVSYILPVKNTITSTVPLCMKMQ